MFFDSWSDLLRIGVTGSAAYVILVLFVRISGKRTLAKMNAFDLVVTVALGSTLATILLSRDVALAEGIAALALLILLQFLVAWTSVRWPGFEKIVKSSPSLLLRDGVYDRDLMRRQRVSEEEIRSALRSAGLAEPAEAAEVILESDGTFSVIPKDR
jgi:uncharacterized membrane protein YcaP (DUF421 family)